MNWLVKRLVALRAFSFPASVLPVPVAFAAVSPVGQWRWDVLAAAAAGAALLHAAGNLLNDYFDYRGGVDRKVAGDEGRPGRLLVRGLLRPADVLGEALACLALAAPLAGYLLWRCGGGLLWFGLGGVVSLYAYTGPPLALKYKALGEPVIFLVFGPLLVLGAAYAQTGRPEPMALLVSVPIGLATTAILVGGNFRDMEEDRQAGIRTLAQVAGGRLVRGLYAALVLGCLASLTVLAGLRLLPRPLLLAPLLAVFVLKPLRCVLRNQRLPDIDARTARFEAVLLLFVLLCLVFLQDGRIP